MAAKGEAGWCPALLWVVREEEAQRLRLRVHRVVEAVPGEQSRGWAAEAAQSSLHLGKAEARRTGG